MSSSPAAAAVRVLITGAAGQIGYSLIPIVARGDVFGREQSIILHLLDIPPMKTVLDGVVMEINDCAFPLVQSVVATTDEAEAFKDIDAAFLVGSMPRREGMERKDLLAANVKIFASQGRALANHSKADVRVLVVGNPANTNALIAAKFAAPKIPSRNITAMTRLDQNRAQHQLAARNGCPVSRIERVIIWGNHSSTQFPDISNALMDGQPIKFDGHDEKFIQTIQKRGAAVISARKLSSAMSAAKAAADHMHDWWNGTKTWVSMGVISDGNPYGIADGIIFSFPVECHGREWKIVPNLSWDDVAKSRIQTTADELLAEKQDALSETENA
ncbi:malate dehydrogenase [Dermatophagoides farinae]|uniref:Malate dehydrogenase n=1 Tax=Dermatophagoides farinae TaxID=6954 RepID=A0A9D4P3H8_DERFA|nr:malate dehydrogenase, cytoplasmic-like [Dermatophagoides farinae]KAH7642942.1 malate dehydrogenase [Dermatophagoides farinae]